MNKFIWEYSKAGLSIPKGCGTSQHHWTKQDFGVRKVGREKSLYLYPDPGPQAARTPQAQIQTKRKEAGALLGSERQGFGRRRASDNQGVEKEPATRPAAPHADEWEARETAARPGEPPSLSHATPVVLSPYHRDYRSSGGNAGGYSRRRNCRGTLETEATTQRFKRNGRQIAAWPFTSDYRSSGFSDWAQRGARWLEKVAGLSPGNHRRQRVRT